MMNRKTRNIILAIAIAGLGIGGLALILISIFGDSNTMGWGLLCVAMGSLCNIILMHRAKKSAE